MIDKIRNSWDAQILETYALGSLTVTAPTKDEAISIQLTYADEGFIHYENDYDIEVFDTVRSDQMFSEEFNYEEARLSGSNPIQHNGEILYEIDTNTRLQLAVARKNHRHQGERGEENKIEDSKRAEAVIAQYFANGMCIDEAEKAEYLLNDLPF